MLATVFFLSEAFKLKTSERVKGMRDPKLLRLCSANGRSPMPLPPTHSMRRRSRSIWFSLMTVVAAAVLLFHAASLVLRGTLAIGAGMNFMAFLYARARAESETATSKSQAQSLEAIGQLQTNPKRAFRWRPERR